MIIHFPANRPNTEVSDSVRLIADQIRDGSRFQSLAEITHLQHVQLDDGMAHRAVGHTYLITSQYLTPEQLRKIDEILCPR